MKVHILSAYEESQYNYAFRNLRKASLTDFHKKHELELDPKLADIIIFVETDTEQKDNYFFELLKHPIYKQYKKKCYLYHDNDDTITLLPTISPSICKSFYNKKIHTPYHYIEQIFNNPYIEYQPERVVDKKFLFSFIGASRTYPKVRDQIITYYQGDDNILDTKDLNSWELEEEERDIYYKSYAQILMQSKFILCPRGIGPSSYRQYESMKMGIAPVIISDEWVAPHSIDWKSCSIRIQEKDVGNLEEILKSRESEYIELGHNARINYDQYMISNNQFHLLSDAAAKLHSVRKQVTFKDYVGQYKRVFEPFHFQNVLRFYKKAYL
jgi:hypothetical protein